MRNTKTLESQEGASETKMMKGLRGDSMVDGLGEEFDLAIMELARQRRAQILTQVGESAGTSVMTPLNPRWEKFARMLAKAIQAEGCDSKSLRLSERLLRGMHGIDAARSLDFFRADGGYCDCEVLLNVGQ